ncbi:MAG: hypothetical protein JWM68_4792 [Verrucomicrobiales bacterium]|nr:hypothetical protein [Verrucomicrobiales bacterium]
MIIIWKGFDLGYFNPVPSKLSMRAQGILTCTVMALLLVVGVFLGWWGPSLFREGRDRGYHLQWAGFAASRVGTKASTAFASNYPSSNSVRVNKKEYFIGPITLVKLSDL